LKYSPLPHRFTTAALALVLAAGAAVPVSAFFWNKKGTNDTSAIKTVTVGQSAAFSAEDFSHSGQAATLTSVTFDQLPDPGAGVLLLQDQSVTQGAMVDAAALPSLRFLVSPDPVILETTLSFTPSYTSGSGAPRTITLKILDQANHPPIARNMSLSTYRDVSLTSWFDALDNEGEVLTFQLTSTPARGAVTMSEDGSSQFVYTPYEGKTGKDSFTYVAIDPLGNTSSEAKVTIHIDKPNTKVTYADMDGNAAHKASIRLAEEGIYVGAHRSGSYFFQPEQSVSRGEFLSLAMAVSGLEPMEGVSMTGFYDDLAIPSWCKGYVSSALKAGVVRGSTNELGQPVFDGNAPITMGEATVMLNNLLSVSDVSVETFGSGVQGHWASQAAANLASAGVSSAAQATTQTLSSPMSRGEAAMLLDGAMDVVENRANNHFF